MPAFSFQLLVVVVLFLSLLPTVSQSQQGAGRQWGGVVEGLAVYQDSANLSEGGSFKAQRAFVRAGSLYRPSANFSAGLFISAGRFSYDFSLPGNAPWDDISDLRLSAPLRFSAGGNATVFVVPSLRFDYQRGVSMSDGRTYGAFGGVTWEVSDRLTIGPAVGVFTQIEESDLDVFPALLLDWDISDRWNLSTGTGLGATQGPGISLSHQYTDELSFSLGVRSEKVRFRLDDQGLAPNGVGEDSSIPVVLAVDYKPNPAMSLTAFAGAEFNGNLQLDDASGATISRQSYDTAPILGFAFRMRF